METALTTMTQMRNTLTSMSAEFAAALPAQIPVERFVRIALTAVQMQPALLDADRRSLLATCMRAAQDGLLLDGREAAPVVFKTKNGPVVQYMPMLAGILKKVRNSGELASIAAHVVYEHDTFDYVLGDDERIRHKPSLEDRGKAIAVYAIARTRDNATYREVMSVADVERVRAASRARDNGPWVTWWDEMARKTVIKRLAKRLPSSADLDSVIAADNDASGVVTDLDAEAVSEPTNPRGAARLRAAIAVGQDVAMHDVPLAVTGDGELVRSTDEEDDDV